MKNVISVFAIAAAVAFTTVDLKAQESFGSAGLEIAIPLGDFGDIANFGIGGSGTYEIGLSDKFSVLAHAGVIFYSVDDIEFPVLNPDGTFGTETLDYSIYQIPLQAGARFYLSEQKDGLYLGALLGMHITGFSIGDESDSDSNFSFAPEVGYFLNESISIGLRYQIVTGEDSNLDYLGARIAYNF